MSKIFSIFNEIYQAK